MNWVSFEAGQVGLVEMTTGADEVAEPDDEAEPDEVADPDDVAEREAVDEVIEAVLLVVGPRLNSLAPLTLEDFDVLPMAFFI